MNKLIKQLAIKSGAAPLPGSEGIFINSLNLEMYTQLVIEECVKAIVEEPNLHNNLIEACKQHFYMN
jgi:hypothetical protein